MLRRAPVTSAIAALSVAATLLLPARPAAWSPLTTWLIHASLRQLVFDVGAWTLLGLWIEPRLGSRRLLAWTLVCLAATQLVHTVLYPGHRALFGLSAICYSIASGALAWSAAAPWPLGRERWWPLLGLAGLGCFLADELLHGASVTLRITGSADAWTSLLPPGQGAEPVPPVHLAGALLGLALGLAARGDAAAGLTPGSRPARSPRSRSQRAAPPG